MVYKMAAARMCVVWFSVALLISPVFSQGDEVSYPPGLETNCEGLYMDLVLDRSYFPDMDPTMLFLNDSACGAHAYNESHIVMRAPLESCGTTWSQSADVISFYNMARTIITSNTSITRMPDYEINFACSYFKTAVLSLEAFKPTPKVTVIGPKEEKFGKFDFKIDMYQTDKYISSYSNFPVKVHVGERIFLQVKLRSNNTDLLLFVDNCKATPTVDPNDPSAYPLIKDGCTLEGTLDYKYTKTSFQRFSLKTFRFLPKSSDVYVHCQVVICHKANDNSRCAEGCPPKEGLKKRRHLSPLLNFTNLETERFNTSLGPLQLLFDRVPGTDEPQVGPLSGASSHWSFLIFARLLGSAVVLRCLLST